MLHNPTQDFMNQADSTIPPANTQVVRETVESLAVAFILALLFKAFIAEAFVIPTGSMAPTLMGAHKDIRCEECNYQFQCGASVEFTDVGAKTRLAVVGAVCPLCRKPQPVNPNRDSNHVTFSGDRILVSKLAYIFAEPRRWDVIVFKWIGGARLNYIKRCIGLPNETVRIRDGDIFVQPSAAIGEAADAAAGSKRSGFEIARKPPHVINATAQLLSDTQYRPKKLLKAGLPSPWQPFPAKDSTWQIENTEAQWSASVQGLKAGETQWLRFYHRVIDPVAWKAVEETGAFPAPVSPQSFRLVTDFTGYNAGYIAREAPPAEGFDGAVRGLMDSQNKNSVADASFDGRSTLENDGLHWVGDLTAEIDIQIQSGADAISLLLVEAGVEHVCRIDLKTGVATATVLVKGQQVPAFESGGQLADKATATTSVRSGGRYRLRFANVDDSLVLWVNGKVVSWSPSDRLQTLAYLPLSERKPKTTPENPLDAAPVAIGLENGGAEVFRARVYRDLYYIAAGDGAQQLNDYPRVMSALMQSSSPENNDRYAAQNHNLTSNELSKKMSLSAMSRNAIMTNPNQWSNSQMFEDRRTVDFRLQPDQYFPMGDNSSASSDARSWREHHSPERLMIGRAVMVFWPHYWNAPVRFLPNVQRMGLIR
jgi:signal peptidase I